MNNINNYSEINLKVEKVEEKNIVLTEDETEITLPKRYLPKPIVIGDELVLTLEHLATNQRRKKSTASELLNEIFNQKKSDEKN